MKVLVTGATGFVGSHAVKELLAQGLEVRLLARTPSKVPTVLGPLGVTVDDVVQGDMTDADAVARALDGCDAVLHCAAEIGVSGGSAGLGSANVDGARNVLGLAVEKGLDPVIWTSTVSAYIPTTDEVLTADSPLAEPLSAYGAQKRDIELLSRELAAAGAPVVSVVVGGVYGPVSPHLDSSFAAITGALAMGMVAPAAGMGIVDVRDLAQALVATLKPGQGPKRHLMIGQFVTWEQWAAELQEAAGVPVPYTEVTVEQMVEMGRQFDELRAAGQDMPPLSEEAAVIMSAGRPGDDGPTLAELGVSYRPVVETFRDAVAWLRAEGHVIS